MPVENGIIFSILNEKCDYLFRGVRVMSLPTENKEYYTVEEYPAPFAVLLDETKDTIVEPDISVICDKEKLTDRGCTGAPDWIVEVVSPSNISHDYIDKLNLYHQAGVREYWIINPMDEKTTVYNLQEEVSPRVYDFDEVISVGIYRDLSILIRDFL